MPLIPLHNSDMSPGCPLDSSPKVLCLDSVMLSDVWDFIKISILSVYSKERVQHFIASRTHSSIL